MAAKPVFKIKLTKFIIYRLLMTGTIKSGLRLDNLVDVSVFKNISAYNTLLTHSKQHEWL